VLNFQIAQLQSLGLLAADESSGQLAVLGGHLLAVVVFSIIGLIVFVGCLVLIEKLTPFSINKEILEEHNSAVAIVVGAIIIGMSLIIAASVLG
jgi:uncharacterized membrane protein YjfL (UPF0719 family)